MVLFAEMENNGKRHFCVEGVESIPEAPKKVKVTMDLQPIRMSNKRQKLQNKVKSAGANDKVLAEVKKKLEGYKKKEDGEL